MNKKVISSVLEKIDVFLTIALKGLFHWGLGIGLFLV